MLKRGLVDGIDQHAARGGVDHVDVLVAKAGLLAGDVELNRGNAGESVKTQAGRGAVVGMLNSKRKIERHTGGVKSRCAHKALRGIHEIAELDSRGRLRTDNRYRAMLEHGLLERGVDALAFERAIGIARGEVRVVEQPDLQSQTLALVDNKPQVGPPAVVTEIGMRARLEADFADIRAGNLLQILGDRLARLALEPQKRKHMVVVGAAKHLLKIRRHIRSSKTSLSNPLTPEYAERVVLLISKPRQNMTESTMVVLWISHVWTAFCSS